MCHPRYLSAAPALLAGLYAVCWRSSRGVRQALPVLADDPAIRAACRRKGVELVGLNKGGLVDLHDQAEGAGDERPNNTILTEKGDTNVAETTKKQPDYKIVIIAGREFSVAPDVPVETIRQQLVAAGFPDAASAEVKIGKRVVDGVEYQTVELIKKAGTKGLGGHELLNLLCEVPVSAMAMAPGLTDRQLDLLVRLDGGHLAAGEALERIDELLVALRRCSRSEYFQSDEENLCGRFDMLGAIPAAVSEW